MFRAILAVVTGYLVFAVSGALLFQLSGQDPHATPGVLFGIVAVVYGIAFAALAGFLAARIALRNKLIASASVGGIIAAGATVSLILSGRQSSTWSQLSA